jgi:hypothetical protein
LAAGCGNDSQGGEARNLAEDESTSTTIGEIMGTSLGGSEVIREAPCEVQGGEATPQGTDLMVTLTEWKVAPAVSPVEPGTVSFVAENTGKEKHELVIVQGASAEALSTDDTGAMDETKLPEGALVGEIEPFAPGQLCRGNFALTAGSYVLLCNIVEEEDDGTTESHFAKGMHSPFIVTAPH